MSWVFRKASDDEEGVISPAVLALVSAELAAQDWDVAKEHRVVGKGLADLLYNEFSDDDNDEDDTSVSHTSMDRLSAGDSSLQYQDDIIGSDPRHVAERDPGHMTSRNLGLTNVTADTGRVPGGGTSKREVPSRDKTGVAAGPETVGETGKKKTPPSGLRKAPISVAAPETAGGSRKEAGKREAPPSGLRKAPTSVAAPETAGGSRRKEAAGKREAPPSQIGMTAKAMGNEAPPTVSSEDVEAKGRIISASVTSLSSLFGQTTQSLENDIAQSVGLEQLTRLSRATCARVVVESLHIDPTATDTIIAHNNKQPTHPSSAALG